MAEANEELGGRVTIESKLPGLATWARVRDYRTNLIQTMGNVDIYRGSSLSAQDDILAGAEPEGPLVIYDFDHYYMGSCLAELLRKRGNEVTIVTPANAISAWTFMNNGLGDIRVRMVELGIGAVLENYLTAFSNGTAKLASVYRGGDVSSIDCGSLVVVGGRTGNDRLFQELNSDADRITRAGIISVRSIGDCRAPGTIAHAVYSGHECARNIDAGDSIQPFAWERPRIMSTT